MDISQCGKRTTKQASVSHQSGQARLHDNGIFEPRKDGPKVAEQVDFTDNPDCGLHHCALKMQNLTRAISQPIMKILGLKPKNSEKKGFLFWLADPNKLLKTKYIKNFLRKTNPSEPEILLRTKHLPEKTR